MARLTLKPGAISLAELRRISRGNDGIGLAEGWRGPVEAALAAVAKRLAGGESLYGINTGFGKLAKTRISDDELATLQILFHLLQAKFVAVVPALPESEGGKADAPDAAAEGTVHRAEAPPAVPVEVEFSQAFVARKLDDDTKEVVNPKAVQYMAASTKVIASRLTIIKDGNETSVPLTRDTHTLGRHRNNDIVISDPKVSSFHARIDRTLEGFSVVDLKSRNGTYVNGRRVESSRLKAGDEIRVGTARLVYKIDYTSSAS